MRVQRCQDKNDLDYIHYNSVFVFLLALEAAALQLEDALEALAEALDADFSACFIAALAFFSDESACPERISRMRPIFVSAASTLL